MAIEQKISNPFKMNSPETLAFVKEVSTYVRRCSIRIRKPTIRVAHLWQPFETLYKPLKLGERRSVGWLIRKAADDDRFQNDIDLLR